MRRLNNGNLDPRHKRHRLGDHGRLGRTGRKADDGCENKKTMVHGLTAPP